MINLQCSDAILHQWWVKYLKICLKHQIPSYHSSTDWLLIVTIGNQGHSDVQSPLPCAFHITPKELFQRRNNFKRYQRFLTAEIFLRSDDRFMGGSCTEIILNNYGQHIKDPTDGEIFEIYVGMAKIWTDIGAQTHFLFHLLLFSPIEVCQYLSIS